MFSFKIESDVLSYYVELQEKVTFIRGLSGTGKSLLLELILSAKRGVVKFTNLNECEPVSIKDLLVLPSYEYETILEGLFISNHYRLIFIDEDNPVLSSMNLISRLYEHSCSLIIISRDRVKVNFQFSMNSIKKFVSSIENGVTCNRLVDYYDFNDTLEEFEPNVIFTEDSGNMFNMLKGLFKVDVSSSNGAYRIGGKVRKEVINHEYKDVVLLIDNSNFGDNWISVMYQLRNFDVRLLVISPYSSEQLLLPMVDWTKLYLSEEPLKYFNHLNYKSIENYFEDVINDCFKDKLGIEYSKNFSNPFEYFKPNLLKSFMLSVTNSRLGLDIIEYFRYLSQYIAKFDVKVMKYINNNNEEMVNEAVDTSLFNFTFVNIDGLGKAEFYNGEDYKIIKKANMLIVLNKLDESLSYKNCDAKLAKALIDKV